MGVPHTPHGHTAATPRRPTDSPRILSKGLLRIFHDHFMDAARTPTVTLRPGASNRHTPTDTPCEPHGPHMCAPHAPHCQLTDTPRTPHGHPTDTPRTPHGHPTDNPWALHGHSTGSAWAPHGHSTNCPWAPHEHPKTCPMDPARVDHGHQYMCHEQPMGVLHIPQGQPMGALHIPQGQSMGSPRTIRGQPLEPHGQPLVHSTDTPWAPN